MLRQVVGSPQARLRQDQWEAVAALVAQRRRVLVVQRTGWGKSAVYFVATVLLREGWGSWRQGEPLPAPGNRAGVGATVIVSPLLSLMRDQVEAAARAGIQAVTINSANPALWPELEEQVRSGQADLLLVSPERLNNPVFREEVLPQLAAACGLVVIDEAHCVSDWGHDFRPDYRRIRALLEGLSPSTPVLATTATANARVSTDVAEQLSPTQADDPGAQVLVLRGPLGRASLHLGVRQLPDGAARLAWLTSYLRQAPGSGIVYCLTVAAAAELGDHLREAGLEVATYTGQTDPAERERLEDDLRGNRVKALVATSALGMGFDKPDLAFVVHLGAPASPVSYYQQIGRAGRGVERAEVVLLPGAQDRAIWRWFDSQGFPPQAEVEAVLSQLAQARAQGQGPLSTAVLETATSLRRTRLESMLKVLDVEGAVQRVRGGWQASGEPWSYDTERYERVAGARLAEQDSMLAYEALEAPGCRMAYLRAALDDPQMPAGWRCGQCDLCGGLVLPGAASQEQLERAAAALARVGVSIEPRRQWPTGMERLGLGELRGRVKEGLRASRGLAVSRLDTLGATAQLRELIDSGQDTQVPPGLRPAVLEVAERLGQMASPDQDGAAAGELVVVVVGSRARPRLVRQIGHAVAQHLGARPLGVVAAQGPAGEHAVGSARRLAAVARSLSLEGWSEASLARLDGARVVLVDDWTDSGWTLTFAAQLLRERGAASVHPLVLAQR